MSQFDDSSPPAAPPVAEKRPRVILVAALARNGVIGVRGKLPWHLPADLQHFKALTLGHPLLMGRKTWESLARRPLPGRDNIVVTRQPGYAAPGARVVASLEAALALCAGEAVAFVIGGAELYAAALPRADALALTEIHANFEGDVRFPAFSRAEWRETERRAQADDGLRFDFVLYERKRG